MYSLSWYAHQELTWIFNLLILLSFFKLLGIYLSDLMYIEDSYADEVDGGLINFEKRRLKADIIMQLQQFQKNPYCLTV